MLLVYEVLAHFEFKIHKGFKIISSLCVLNCFKYFLVYILGQNVLKKLDKKNCQGTISSLYVLNYFKYFQIYILGQMFQKNPTKCFLNYIKS